MFNDIRPYYLEEINAAMQRIASHKHLPVIASYIFPDKSPEEVRELIRHITSAEEFQDKVMVPFNRQVIRDTIGDFTYSGLEKLDPQKRYLFLSNHRDIVMDASLLQQIFYEHQIETSEISFGSNLMTSQLVIDVGRSNKMFKVQRKGGIRELYARSLQLSSYLRHCLLEKRHSAWIAQRRGRTKDGHDVTNQGVIRMLGLSHEKDHVQAIIDLNIVPIAVSYEIEPCDFFKTKERYLSREGRSYVKGPKEDFISVLSGITQQKGNVHVSICDPLTEEEVRRWSDLPLNEFNRAVAEAVDQRIYKGYKLHCNNYVAHDLRSGSSRYAAHYTPFEKAQFVLRMMKMCQVIDGDDAVLQGIFLGIYANPVDHATAVD